jgi:hypothetical protein
LRWHPQDRVTAPTIWSIPPGRGRLETIASVIISSVIPLIVVSARVRWEVPTVVGWWRWRPAAISSATGGNPACIDRAGSTNNDTISGGESYLTNPICCQNRTKIHRRVSPCPMNCPKTRSQRSASNIARRWEQVDLTYCAFPHEGHT